LCGAASTLARPSHDPDEQERHQVAVLSEAVQEATGGSVEIAYGDQGYTGDDPDADAASYDL
jgi:hypothetical protein